MFAVLKQQNSSTATDALWPVVESGDIDRLEELVAEGADVNRANHDGVTALMRAARKGHPGMVDALIKHGADLDARRLDGFTALLLAVFFGHREVVKLLVKRGADLNAVTRGGTSAEMWAKARCFPDIAHYLENAGKGRQLLGNELVRTATKNQQASVGEDLPQAPASARVTTTEQVKAVNPQNSFPRPAAINPENPPISPLAIRTLKDPPDIWELVPEARLQFSPRQAFSTHLATAGTKLVVGLVVVTVLIVCWAVLRERSVGETDSAVQPPHEYQSTAPGAGHSESPGVDLTGSSRNKTQEGYHHADGAAHSTQAQPESSEEMRSDSTSETVVLSSKRNFGPKRLRQTSQVRRTSEFTQNDLSRSDSELTDAVRTVDTNVEPVNRTQPTNLPSTQLITPAASPRRKPKVIQWP